MLEQDFNILNQKYSVSQFRNNPEYMALIGADAELKSGIQANAEYLLNNIDLNKSEGVLLDNWGTLLGIARSFFDIEAYFSYNRADVNTEKYVWFSEPESDYIVPSGSLDDRDYRTRIKAKAGQNVSRCTREENIAIIKNMTFARKVKIKNVEPLLLDITLVGDNLFLTQDIKSDIEAILGNGVGIRNLTTENE